jgi:hypothetical protein
VIANVPLTSITLTKVRRAWWALSQKSEKFTFALPVSEAKWQREHPHWFYFDSESDSFAIGNAPAGFGTRYIEFARNFEGVLFSAPATPWLLERAEKFAIENHI